jgi:hypothetical protein
MASYAIVRFEGADWAVLEDDQAKTFLVPRRWLPTDAHEGDVVKESAQPPGTDTVSLRLDLDKDATRERAASGKPGRK